MRRLKLGIDLDGVCADFIASWLALMNPAYGLTATHEDQSEWGAACFGLTKAQEDALWERITSTEEFWYNMRPLPGVEALSAADDTHELYFITNRVPAGSRCVKEQSSEWLYDHAGILYPTVLLAPRWFSKPDLYKALALDAHIDDKPETIQKMRARGQNAWILDQPYNRHVHAERVATVADFIRGVEEQLGQQGSEG